MQYFCTAKHRDETSKFLLRLKFDEKNKGYCFVVDVVELILSYFCESLHEYLTLMLADLDLDTFPTLLLTEANNLSFPQVSFESYVYGLSRKGV